jgi:hypothetical protein
LDGPPAVLMRFAPQQPAAKIGLMYFYEFDFFFQN